MNNSRYQLLLFIVFPLMGLFYSCVRNSPCPAPPATITEYLDYKDSIPYAGYDTLIFIRILTGDTHTFIGQGKIPKFAILSRPSGDADCPANGGDARTEEISFKYVSTTFPSPILLGMYYQTYDNDYFYIKFNNQVFERASLILSRYIYDSIEVRNKFYYKATRVATDDDPYSIDNYTLYNARNGILKFQFKNGEVWELLPK